MKRGFTDKDLRVIAQQDRGMLTHAPALAEYALTLRGEVRRLRMAIKGFIDTAHGDARIPMQRRIDAALSRPSGKGKRRKAK